MWKWISLGLFAMALAYYAGYQAGQAVRTQAVEGNTFTSEDVIDKQTHGLGAETSQTLTEIAAPESLKQADQAVAEIAEVTNNVSEAVIESDELNEYEQAFAADLAHQREQVDFEQHYSVHQQDIERETRLTDFLQLHEDAEKIDLYKVQCNTDECLLIGKYAGDHKIWEAIVEQMRTQDWWDFTGTSHTSSTRESMTYFTMYISRKEKDKQG